MSTTPDFEVHPPPTDPVSALAFHPGPASSPKVQQLLIASWDKTVRQVDLSSDQAKASGSAPTLHTFYHDAAVLDVCWVDDTLAASGGLDRRVRLLDLESGQMNIIGKHDAAVSKIRYNPHNKILITGSWDKTFGVWDVQSKTGTLLRRIKMPDKIFAMDVSPPFPSTTQSFVDETRRLIVSTAGRMLVVFKLDELSAALRQAKENGTDLADDDAILQPEYSRESSLKFMLRDVKCMPNGDGKQHCPTLHVSAMF